MPARRLLPLLALGLAAACGRGADSTGAATTTSTLPAGPGVHDHTPHHGGVGGMAVEMGFVLPVGAGGAGAAGVPVHGCVALAGSPGAARAPRCTLDFAHPVTVVAATPDGALALVAAVDLGVSVWRLPAGQL